MSVSLMSREYGGLAVDIYFAGTDAKPILSVQIIDGENDPVAAIIPNDKVMDAFNHPFCYLPRLAVQNRMPEDNETEEDVYIEPGDNDYNRNVA